jgi:hypothetical protein
LSEEQDALAALGEIRSVLQERASRLHGCLDGAQSDAAPPKGGGRRKAEIDVANLVRFDKEVRAARACRYAKARLRWLWEVAERWGTWLGGGR